MHFSKIALAAVAAGSAMAADQSICDKYTIALLKNNTAANQYTLLSLLVNTAVIGNFTGPTSSTNAANAKLPGSLVAVPGILNPNGTYMGQAVNLLPYFSGGLKSTNNNGVPSVQNFLDGGSAAYIIANPTMGGMKPSAQYTLLTHLYEYFGALLGCSQYGMGAFPAYGGDNSMYSVHQYMDLSQAQFSYFVTQVGLAAASFGVTQSDITAAAGALNMAFGYACAPAATIIPSQPAASQAICIGTGCSTASGGSCPTMTPTMPVAAMTSGAMSSGAMASVTPMSSSGAVGQKTDGQITVSTLYSSAGAAPMQTAQAVLAGLAGLAAIAL